MILWTKLFAEFQGCKQHCREQLFCTKTTKAPFHSRARMVKEAQARGAHMSKAMQGEAFKTLKKQIMGHWVLPTKLGNMSVLKDTDLHGKMIPKSE